MTIGTAIVISVAIICGTFLAACILGMIITKNKKKNDVSTVLANTLSEQIQKKLKEKLE